MESIVPIFHSLSKNLRNIHKESSEEISVVQSSILYEISLLTNPSMQEVAEAVGMDITTFSRQIASLVKMKFVEKNPYEQDRRIHLLSLTERGEVTVESINVVIAAKMETAFTSMTHFERDIVIKSIHVLNEKLKVD